MSHFYDTCAGPIRGLYLPAAAWDVLRQVAIQTSDQLKADADRLEQFHGIEPRIAQVIRQALACAALSEDRTSGDEFLSPWCA
jgi:hypothetical protein